jgi:pimeloyl-ACP methyl ester carboxylesterase
VDSSIGTIVLVPGMMSHSGWFHELTRQLIELRMDVVGADRRGSGLNWCRRGDAPSREILVSDLSRIVTEEHRGAPVYLIGWCWGALSTINAALDLGDILSGVVLLAPGLFPSEQIRHSARKAATGLPEADLDLPVLQSPVSEEMFSNRPSIRDFIHNDDLAQRTFTPRFFRISREMSLIAATRLSQLTQPLLVLLAENDATVDNERTLMALQTLHRTDVTTAVLPCNHGMHFELPDEIVKHISCWLNIHPQPA